MIRNLLATTAIATLVATGAVAQTTDAPSSAPSAAPSQPAAEMTVRAEGHLTSNIIGKSVYNGSGQDAENIGKVNDVVLDKDGNARAIVVGVGGFLGIGEKEVALEYDLVEWAEIDGDRWIVVETTSEALEAQQEFDRSAYRPMPADADVSETEPATKDDLDKAPTQQDGQGEAMAPSGADDGMTGAGDGAVPAEGGDAAQAPADTAESGASAPADEQAEVMAPQSGTDSSDTAAPDRSSLQEMPADKIRAEDFTGTTVYGAEEQTIGEIGDIIVSQDGNVDAVIVDVGGFLGVGGKEVAIGMDNLAFMTDGQGALYLYTEFTEQELENQPAYDEATYGERREEMRMQVQ